VANLRFRITFSILLVLRKILFSSAETFNRWKPSRSSLRSLRQTGRSFGVVPGSKSSPSFRRHAVQWPQ
jgi:hypothetical protein